MNKKIILIIVYIIMNQSLCEQLSPRSKQRAAASRAEEPGMSKMWPTFKLV